MLLTLSCCLPLCLYWVPPWYLLCLRSGELIWNMLQIITNSNNFFYGWWFSLLLSCSTWRTLRLQSISSQPQISNIYARESLGRFWATWHKIMRTEEDSWWHELLILWITYFNQIIFRVDIDWENFTSFSWLIIIH